MAKSLSFFFRNNRYEEFEMPSKLGYVFTLYPTERQLQLYNRLVAGIIRHANISRLHCRYQIWYCKL